MACNQDSLKGLENLIDVFFNNETTNEKKHEIESILLSFGQQEEAWKQCLYYLSTTQNSHVSMFCLTSLENIINKKWLGIPSEAKGEIRATLYRFVLEHHRRAPSYIRNKLVKIIVDIARLSWPHFYPDFFTNVLSLARSPDTEVLCIVFLQTISEELVSSRAELSHHRKTELKKLLAQQVPAILSVLTGFLDGVIEKHKNSGTTTPPPSPTHGNHSPSPSLIGFGGNSSFNIQNGSLMNSMIQSLNNENGETSKPSIPVSLPPLDPESETVAALSLSCLAHLFSWITLSSLITPHLLNTIFVLASLGADPQHNKNNLNGTSDCLSSSHLDISILSSNSLGVLAMSAINEILSKNCIPQDLEDFLLQIFKNTFNLLLKLVQNKQGGGRQLEILDPDYLDKFSEFLRLFVSLHLRRFENNRQFPILDFLSLLSRYTFLQPNVDCYFSCLEIWSIFLDHLSTKVGTEDQATLTRYEDTLVTLARDILRKVQLRLNQAELEELEHELSEDATNSEDDLDSLFGDLLMGNGMTEWQAFYSHNLEIIAKVSDIFPDQIFSLMYEPFNDGTKIYLLLQDSIITSPSSNNNENDPNNRPRRTLSVAVERESRQLHCFLRDFSTLLQGIGRLSMLFLGENLSKRSPTAMQIIQKLIELANYSNGLKLFELSTAVAILHQDFVEVHAQILSTLRAWTHWLSQLYGQQFIKVYPGGTQIHQYQETCYNINKQLLIIAANVLSCGAPPLVVSCGIQLLSSLSVLVRSPVALEMGQIQDLYSQATSYPLEVKVRHCLYRALVNFLLLPWPSFVVDHKIELRKQHLESFLHSLTKDLMEINIHDIATNKTLQENHSNRIIESLMMIRAQVDELNGADKSSREIYYQCVKNVIQNVILLFPVYVSHSEVCEEILALIVMIIQVLRHQMGPAQVVATIQTFLDVFTTNHHLYLAVSENQHKSVKVVEKFLKLLELVISEPGATFQRFIPNVIILCMEHIYPIVAEKPSPEIKGPIFKVMHCLFDNNWKYFFKSSVQSSLGSNQWDICENQAQFVQIMEAFGQSFMQPDIGIFKQNLETLETLNSKYKLYHKAVFRTTMLGQFITVLLQTLVHRSHDLLQEEITLTVYNMAAVDFEAFFYAFLAHFLQQMEGITEDQKEVLKEHFKPETDLPSFTQNTQRFVNDLRFYRMCNASLPPGTIKF